MNHCRTKIGLFLLVLGLSACGRANFGNLGFAQLLSLQLKAKGKSAAPYLIGLGEHDITGPASGVQMMGYVVEGQVTSGIHNRLRARSFIIAQPDGKRVALINADLIHIYQGVKQEVIRELKNRYGDLYTDDNTMLAATHTHSGPGNFSHYYLYNLLFQFSHSHDNFNAIVNGIVESLARAHRNLEPGYVSLSTGVMNEGLINRAPKAYVLNQDKDIYDESVDRESSQLNFYNANGTPMGVANWLAVHPTSVKAENKLINGDNKGYASYIYERMMKKNYRNDKGFVAAFFNGAAGDVSPNTAQDINGDGDWDCPLLDSFLCGQLSADQHVNKSIELFEKVGDLLTGSIDYRHKFVDMSNVVIDARYSHGQGEGNTTCPAAIGISMLAGAKDNHGIGKEVVNCDSLGVISKMIICRKAHECHGQKAVAVPTGNFDPPWTPQVLPVQVVRIGRLAFAAVPAEFTTMSGRRTRATVKGALASIGVDHVILTGYANAYAGYVATPEEYQLQNYEGASTHFGEWTLPAYRQSLEEIAIDMRDDKLSPIGATPRNLIDHVSEMKDPRVDKTPKNTDFGDVLADVNSNYETGDTATVTFVGANLSNNLRLGSSFLEIQQLTDSGWVSVAYDWDLETKMYWVPKKKVSSVKIEWSISKETQPGTYRIMHNGTAKVDKPGTVTETIFLLAA